MIAHYQCVIVENKDTGFKAALPGEIRQKYSKYGPRPLPRSVRNQQYFPVSAPFNDFESPDDFLLEVSKYLTTFIQDGTVTDPETLRRRFHEESRFRVGEVGPIVKPREKSDRDLIDLEDIFDRAKF